MAIPFNVENNSDYDEAVLQVLLSDLCRTLQQIALFRSSRRAQNLNGVRPTTSLRHTETERTLLNSTVDLALSLSQSQNEIENPQQNSSSSSVAPLRRHRRRSRSEPSCCEEVKPVVLSVAVEVTNKDWIQKENHIASSAKKPWYGSDSLLSKLIPAQLSGPLWTAVICMVGWHLLRTR